ncbi:MAG: hypothetical protein Q9164_002288 [Protoblastenia rupestris]
MTTTKPAHLEPSELGTKEYWDTTYSTELAQTPPDPDSSLSGWFSDVNASSKILKYLSSPALGLDKHSTTFLDLGTGNGEMLFSLREEGSFRGYMLGVDYSQQSVDLCRKWVGNKGLGAGGRRRGLEFEVWDIMSGEALIGMSEGFDVVLDKGTFDAICLSDETDAWGRRLCEGYRERIEGLVREGGILLVTSCNWTEEELKGWFESEQNLETIVMTDSPPTKTGV